MERPSRLVLLGHPVSHSLSPRFQQAALDALGIPLRYEALDVAPADFAATMAALRGAGAAGNITVPHKQAALACCDAPTPLAQRVGAVNTFWTEPAGRLHGDNTDVGGLREALRALLGRDLAGLRIVVLGAGGAALALREAVAAAPGATLQVIARRAEQATRFVAPLGARGAAVAASADAQAAAVAHADVIVNATPLGLGPDDAFPWDPAQLQAEQAVLDLAYGREGPTRWVAACRARGLRADDGLGMLVEQGALAFERWFGLPAPREVMRAAVPRLR